MASSSRLVIHNAQWAHQLQELSWLKSPAAFYLKSMAEYLSIKKNSGELLSDVIAKAKLFPHQLAAADTVLNSPYRGGILSDEVGLGKTIEAAIVIKELICRQEAEKIIILTPASLTTQWREEMKVKFNEEFTLYDASLRAKYDRIYQNKFNVHNKVIISIDSAKNEPVAEQIREIEWDLVVVDEAHNIKNSQTDRYKLIAGLKRKYILLLTATPLQNNLDELYTIVSLISERLFSSHDEFNRLYAESSGAASGGGSERMRYNLQQRLKKIIVRNRKCDLNGIPGLRFSERNATMHYFTLSEAEQHLYDEVTMYIKEGYVQSLLNKSRAYGFYMIMVQKMLLSSLDALKKTLSRRLEKIDRYLKSNHPDTVIDCLDGYDENSEPEQIDDRIDTIDARYLQHETNMISAILRRAETVGTQTKMDKLLTLIRNILNAHPEEKIIIFTEFYSTQSFIASTLTEEAFSVSIFNGAMSPAEKDNAVELFRRSAQVLICTEAGGEGRNLQFAHILVNYDFPWNPMKVEQRIGRIHRIGQEKPVEIINLITQINQKVTILEPSRGDDAVISVEEHLIHILEKKINLFRDVVGDLDSILGRISDQKSFDQRVMDLITSADRDGVEEQTFGDLEGKIETAVKQYRKEKQFDEKTLRQFDFSLKYQYEKYQNRYQYRQDNNKVRAFVYNYFKYKRSPFNPNLDVIHAVTPENLVETYHLPKNIYITFDKEISMNAPESVEYITYNQPLLDAIQKESIRLGEYGEFEIRLSDYNVAEIKPHENWQGALFLFKLTFQYEQTRSSLLPLLIDSGGIQPLNFPDNPDEFFAVPFAPNRGDLSGVSLPACYTQAESVLREWLDQRIPDARQRSAQRREEQQITVEDYVVEQILSMDTKLLESHQALGRLREELLKTELDDQTEVEKRLRKVKDQEKKYLQIKQESAQKQKRIMKEQETQLRSIAEANTLTPTASLITMAKIGIVY